MRTALNFARGILLGICLYLPYQAIYTMGWNDAHAYLATHCEPQLGEVLVAAHQYSDHVACVFASAERAWFRPTRWRKAT